LEYRNRQWLGLVEINDVTCEWENEHKSLGMEKNIITEQKVKLETIKKRKNKNTE
jgi:hypothetical protein